MVDFKGFAISVVLCYYYFCVFVSVCMYGCTAAYLGQDTLEKEIFNLNEFLPVKKGKIKIKNLHSFVFAAYNQLTLRQTGRSCRN